MNSEEKIIDKHTSNLRKGFHYWSHQNEKTIPAMGDFRWTDDLIFSTWYQAENKRPPSNREYKIGNSNGGFDRLDFKFLEKEKWIEEDAIDLSMPLNKRRNGPQLSIPIPFYGAGMSFGSVSENIMVSRAKAAKEWNTFTCTGEGGYPEALEPYRDNVITQVATGLFGVSEWSLLNARIIELKYAQGAKPGLGGHLLADKATTIVAALRQSVPWVSLFSPFPFHSVYSVEDHKKQIDWIRTVNPNALISVKVATPIDIDMVAVGSYFANANILHIDGSYGGTGAAPEIAKKNIAMPIECAIPKVHRYLVSEGIRDEIVVMASGGIRTAYDIAKAIALGADGCVLGTVELVALGCTRCANCERGRGCPFGLTTTDKELQELVNSDWGAMRISNLYASIQFQLKDILKRLGLKSIPELRGRHDLLVYHEKS